MEKKVTRKKYIIKSIKLKFSSQRIISIVKPTFIDPLSANEKKIPRVLKRDRVFKVPGVN